MLKFTFLGTSSSRPTVRRGVSSLAVQREGDLLLFDCGEGTQRQMLRFGVGFGVSRIMLSHLHADHVLGLPGLLRTMSLQDRTETLIVHCPEGTEHEVREVCLMGGDRLGFDVRVEGVAPESEISLDGYRVRAFPTDHTARSVGYALIEPERLGRFDVEKARALGVPEGPLFGALHRGQDVEVEGIGTVRAGDLVGPSRPGRTAVYTGDTRPCEATREVARGADLLVHEATFTDAEHDRAVDTRHSTAREAAQVAADAGVERLLLTHISARYSEQPHRLELEARKVFRHVSVAEDGTAIDIPFREESE